MSDGGFLDVLDGKQVTEVGPGDWVCSTSGVHYQLVEGVQWEGGCWRYWARPWWPRFQTFGAARPIPLARMVRAGDPRVPETETPMTTESPSSLPAVIERPDSPPSLAPSLSGPEAVHHAMDELKAIRTFVAKEMKPDLDFGKIPGTGDKPTLLLPGAQKIAMFFNTWPDYTIQSHELGEGHVEYIVTTRLLSRASGAIVGSGVGSCSTMESKHRFRGGARRCPNCNSDAISRSQYKDSGWYCNRKRGGCGANFAADDPAITSQTVGKVENPNIHDTRNTVLKIAKKRSLVDSAHGLGCLSELFTQDLDDIYDLGAEAASPSPRRSSSRENDPGPDADPAALRRRRQTKADLAKPFGTFLTDQLEAARTFFRRQLPAGVELVEETGPNVHQVVRHLVKWANLNDAGYTLSQADALRLCENHWRSGEEARVAIREEVRRYLKAEFEELMQGLADEFEPEADDATIQAATEAAERN